MLLIILKIAFGLQMINLSKAYVKPSTFLERQNDYRIKTEWFELFRHDKELVPVANLIPFKFNRTCMAINFTLMYSVDVGNQLELVVQAYKFLSNEYRIYPLRFQMNFCESLAANAGGMSGMLKCGNFTGCPIRKGVVYYVCNFVIDEHKFPPLIPNGKFMVEFQGVFRSREAFVLRGHFVVDRPIRIP